MRLALKTKSTQFDWDAIYGDGFDVLNFNQLTTPSTALLFLSNDYSSNLCCKICLEELGVPYQTFGVHATEAGKHYFPTVSFHDTDSQKTQVDGVIPILFHLTRFYRKQGDVSKRLYADVVPPLLEQAMHAHNVAHGVDVPHFLPKLDNRLSRGAYLSGRDFGIVDYAYWPLVDEVLESRGAEEVQSYKRLVDWYEQVGNRPSVRKSVWSDAQGEAQKE